MAGYSKTPLPKKLGIKPNAVLALVNAPADFLATLGELPPGVEVPEHSARLTGIDVIVFFTQNRTDLSRRFAALAKQLDPAGGFWIAWPKKTSGVETDLNENIIRDIGLKVGLVDNKVCAIDDTWSGLRFVVRLVDRPKKQK
jgi:hypothetical protein